MEKKCSYIYKVFYWSIGVIITIILTVHVAMSTNGTSSASDGTSLESSEVQTPEEEVPSYAERLAAIQRGN